MCSKSNVKVNPKDVQKLIHNMPKLNNIFNIHYKVGEGTFSTVYLASLKNNEEQKKKFAIKHIVPTCHPERIKFELNCLKNIGGVDNVVGIDLCLRDRGNVVFIMPYQAHDSFTEYVGKMDTKETALYMKNLLKAVARVHKFGIIHRDIKPSNFLYDRKNKKYLLVDFGLAQIEVKKSDLSLKRKREDSPKSLEVLQPAQLIKNPFLENTQKNKTEENQRQQQKRLKENNPKFESIISEKNKKENSTCKCYGKPRTCSFCITRKSLQASRAGTPGFRPPEVLLKSTQQTSAVDIWAVGVILLCILSNCCTFFVSPDDMTALAEIINIFGYEAIKKVAFMCGRNFICSEQKKGVDLQKMCCMLRSREKRKIFTARCNNCFCETCVCINTSKNIVSVIEDKFSSSAYDLLKQLLDVNPNTRITAENALKHVFIQNA